MRELLAIAVRHGREMRRARATAVLVAGAVAALVVALAAPEGTGAAAVRAVGVFSVVAATLLVAAVALAGVLPAERDAGRAAWLETLAPGGVVRRAALAAAAAAALLVVATLGGAVAGLLATATGAAPEVRGVRPARAVLVPAQYGTPAHVRVDLAAPARSGDLLEVEVVPRFAAREDAAAWRSSVAWRVVAGARGEGTAAGPARAPLRWALPAGARALRIENRSETAWLTTRAARVLGPPRPFVASALVGCWLAALLLLPLAFAGMAASRATSAPTAAGVVVALLVLGAMRGSLEARPSSEAGRAESRGHDHDHGDGDHRGHAHDHAGHGGALAQGATALAHDLLRGAVLLAPDLSPLERLKDPSSSRALEPNALAAAAGAWPHALVALALFLVPLPRRRSRVP
jgi:hypothetical protein